MVYIGKKQEYKSFKKNFSNANIPARKPNKYDVSKLFVTILTWNKHKIMEFMSKNNFSFNVINENGETLLHAVLQTNNENITEDNKYDLIKFLLNKGVRINRKNKQNITALHLAAKYQLTKIVKLLIKNNADQLATDNFNMTPMHYVAQGNMVTCKKQINTTNLIPSSQIINNKPIVRMKDITANIIEILQTKHFKKYIKQISNSFKNLKDIYPQIYIDNKKYLDDAIDDIRSSNLSSAEIIQQIKIAKKNASTDLSKQLKSKFNKSTEYLDIKSNNSGWKNVLSIIDDPEKKIGYLQKDNFDEKNEVFNVSFLNFTNNMKKNINILINNHKDMFHHLNRLSQNTFNFMLNHKFNQNEQQINNVNQSYKQIDEYVDEFNKITLMLSDLLSYSNAESFMYPDLTLTSYITSYDSNDILDAVLGPYKYDNINEYRGNPKNNNNNWFKIPLSIDINQINNNIWYIDKSIGRIAHTTNESIDTIQNNIINNLINNTIINNKIGSFNKQTYYFISKLAFSIYRINVNYNSLEHNIKLLSNFDNWKYKFEIYHKIGTTMLLSMINIIHCIIFAKNEKQFIYKKIAIIKETYNSELIKKYKEEKYGYSYSHALDAIDDLVNTINNTYDILENNIYDMLIDGQNALNKIVSILNNNSSNVIIANYIDHPYTSNNDIIINNIFDKIFLKFNKLPKSLNDYTDILINKTKKEQEQIIFKKYVPEIINKNAPIYYFEHKLNFGNIYYYDLNDELIDINIPVSHDIKNGYLFENTEVLLPHGNLGFSSNMLIKKVTDSIPQISGKNFDKYLSMLKYKIIQNIINIYANRTDMQIFGVGQHGLIQDNNNPEIITLNEKTTLRIQTTFNNLKEILNIEYDNNIVDENLYSTIGKIIDELLIHYINYSISKNIQYIFPTIDVVTAKKQLNIDTGFTLNFNELFPEIIDSFTSQFNKKTSHNMLIYTGQLMEQQKIHYQHKIYNQNYEFGINNNIIKYQCYNFDPEIVSYLRKAINKKDSTQSTPIFYAYDTLNRELVDTLINNGANVYVKSLKNNKGFTPLMYIINQYENHNNILHSTNLSNMMKKLYSSNYTTIKKNILIQSKYKNNIIKFMDNIFAQSFVIYNNTFYIWMTSFIRNWSFDDLETLYKLFEKYNILSNSATNSINIPLLTNINATNFPTFRYDTLNSQKKIYTDDINKLKKKLKHLSNNKNSMILQIKKFENKKEQKYKNYVENLKNKQKYYDRKFNEFTTEIYKYTNKKKQLNSHITREIDENKLISKINIFIGSTNHINAKTGSELYYNIYNDVTNRSPMTFNKLFYILINDDNKLKHISNIHMMIILLESKIIEKLKTNKNYLEIISELSLIYKFYQNIIIASINDYTKLTQKYKQFNYALDEIINIITNVVKTVICGNLYIAIIKTVTKYKLSKYQKYHKQIYRKRIKKYIMDTLPLKIVKHTLNIFEDDSDADKNIDSVNSLFMEIIEIIKNSDDTIKDDSSLFTNLQEFIFPYYEELLTQFIPNIKLIIDNYNKFMINESRYIKLVILTLEQAIKEQTIKEQTIKEQTIKEQTIKEQTIN